MNARHGQTPIPLPTIVDDPRWIGRFSREVRKSIAALRDRRIIVSGGQRTAITHPWKVSTSADDTVRVSPGKILSLQCPSNPGVSNIPAYFHLKKFSDYAGGEVTGIDDNGYIYGSIPWATGGGTFFEADTTTGISMFELVVPDAGEPITVSFDTSLPTTGDVFVFEIAHVTFADGKISEIEQVLTHNPTMWGFDIPPEA
jgi:hypothetical protein